MTHPSSAPGFPLSMSRPWLWAVDDFPYVDEYSGRQTQGPCHSRRTRCGGLAGCALRLPARWGARSRIWGDARHTIFRNSLPTVFRTKELAWNICAGSHACGRPSTIIVVRVITNPTGFFSAWTGHKVPRWLRPRQRSNQVEVLCIDHFRNRMG